MRKLRIIAKLDGVEQKGSAEMELDPDLAADLARLGPQGIAEALKDLAHERLSDACVVQQFSPS